MPLIPLPLALLEGLGSLLFVVFWVAYQIYSATREKKAEGPVARPLPRDLPADEEGFEEGEVLVADQRAGDAQGELRGEIEQFLDQIGKRQEEPPRRRPVDPFEEPPRHQAPASQPEPPRRPQIEILVGGQEPGSGRRQPPASPIQVGPPPEEVTRRIKLSQLSQTHLPESQLAEQAAHLGEQIAHSDDRLEARLHDKFDHKLGKLLEGGGTPSASQGGPVKATSAARIAALLSNPEGVRDAIVLNEILARPVDRW